MSFKEFRGRIQENISNNIRNILLACYFMFYIIWNNIVLLIGGDIIFGVFLNLILNGINIPVLMIVSLVLTGKYKAAETEKNIDLSLAEKDKELALKEQQIEHLQELSVAYKTNDELKKDLEYQREIAEYRVTVAAIKGDTEDGVIANKDWVDTNEALKEE